MPKPRCVFLDRDSIDCRDLDFGAIEEITEWVTFAATQSSEVAEHAADAEIIIVNKVLLGEQQFASLPELRLVCVIATGTNNIDLAAAARHNVVVCNVRDYAAASVSQHVFMLVLALFTRFLDFQTDVRAGAWLAQDQFCLLTHPMRELNGKTMGLIGYGHIARAVEAIARAFGMRVLISESVGDQDTAQPGRTPLVEVLQQSDVISVHCPLTEQTQDLIDAEQLAMMKPSTVLINTARGGIVNEVALLQALQSGQIAGAGIDCLVTEPPKADDPMITSRLPNLIVTPHNAWGTQEARQRLVDGTFANIRGFLSGQIANRVTP